MLKKRLGLEGIEKDWEWSRKYKWNWGYKLVKFFKIPLTVNIPDGCERLGRNAFDGCTKLKGVVIPESVKYIGRSAFNCCRSLKEVVIPRSVEHIGEFAFHCCSKAIIILQKPKKGFKFIGSTALRNCKDVKKEIGN